MEKRTYIGVTIGPIFKTIQLAKHTGELWGSSYIFSFIMKKIIEKILKNLKNNIEDRFIVPYVGKGASDEIFQKSLKAGIFHDRFIFESRKNEFKLVNSIIEDVKNMVAQKVYEDINNYHEKIKNVTCKQGNDNNKFIQKLNDIFIDNNIKSNIKKYIKEYFQIYCVEVEIDEESIKNNNINIIFEVSKYLDAVELNQKFINSEKKNYLAYFLKNEIIKNSFLARDAFEQSNTKDTKISKKYYKNYPSLSNIAMRDLGVKTDDSRDEGELRNSYKKERKKVHNYVAIVQADGDSISKVIEGLKQSSNDKSQSFKEFSKKLYDYAIGAVDIIEKYGGFTIYAGGDDLLFIAPIINKTSGNDCKSIFELIDLLSEKFESKLRKYVKKNSEKKPTLSFGMSVIHYKYPLYEALKDTEKLLSCDAKKYKCFNEYKNKTIEKDAIAFKVIKHSGQYYKLTLNKKLKSYKKFKEFLRKEITILNGKENKREGLINNLRTISNKLWVQENILNCIGCNLNMLENYFNNNFNEDYHEKDEVKESINHIRDLIFEIYSEVKLEVKDKYDIEELNKIFKEKKVKEKIYTYLKFLRFLGEDEKENDKEGEDE
ncbi:type III-B CRISPR-associated protein Cas10/Cmr2 [Clostridium botulinum]|uniref:GGDEF domain-containing protein n=1 Tax=Clostridium botulinum C/D str. DC5 TaxID=1443128 RepID=A0A0A0ID97_CLOBO|nr:type III-B CRISPR-associated protein Cas10/Cmr2 [Clostridium botulinum]KGM98503.1 hypothetical protein Z955_11430 [Clostridium botulinum C/D str. DC5]KOC51836.1 hypothetical protein ADU89_12725 [Clostridium botulinum]KOC53604.1 hypothetical protein ADU90_13390 [Clostridium botulinum]MCD3234873.1 type III-B CRISPR-associated protein Cas10/Cmr2 [Clostridium botulinum D/C]MCD3240772.1 type III-B CRISPR-associated protein Cas10/Cmr2 [Clostridium botulinum D/C]